MASVAVPENGDGDKAKHDQAHQSYSQEHGRQERRGHEERDNCEDSEDDEEDQTALHDRC